MTRHLRARAAATLLAVTTLVVALVGVSAGPAAAGYSTLCTGYDSCNLQGMPHAGYKEASGTSYWNMATGHNCTNYVAYRMVRSGMPNTRPWTGDGNALNWGRLNPGRTNQTPAVGAVAWWDAYVSPAGESGHVAYVERVVSANEIVISEDNWLGNFYWRTVTRSGPGWPSGFIHFNDVPTGPYGDGTALRASDNGEVYIVAGGAPVYVSSWAAVGGPRATIDISRAALDAMRSVPADGTFVSAGGHVYRFAGGAPIYVSSWAAVGGQQPTTAIDPAAIVNAGGGGAWRHVRPYPADGTFVTVGAGYVYRFAGGAPVYVSSWAAVGGDQPTTLVDGAALENGDGPPPWNHVRRYPADGTFVVAAGHVFRFAGGAPIYVSNWAAVGGQQPATVIDTAALDNADRAVPYNHVHWYPADGTIVRTGLTGGYSKVTGGLPRVTATTAGAVVVDPAAIARRGTGGPYNHLKADPVVPFADVSVGSPFYGAIQWLSGQGITTGSRQPDGTVLFHPVDPVSRQAMAAFLYRAAGSPAFTPPAVSPFADVPVTAAFYKEITWLAERGITTGYPVAGGRLAFRPTESVSRMAMAAFIYRSHGSPAFTPSATSPFADVTTSHPFYREISWLAATKISTGTDVGGGRVLFGPDAAVSRQAVAAFLHRASTV